MERLIRQVFIFSGILVAIGSIVHFAPRQDKSKTIPEAQLEEITPKSVMGVRFKPGVDGPNVTWRMDDASYKVLEYPSAVCRQYEVGGILYDTVVIASRSKDAFHDPNICFQAQNFSIERRTPITISTEHKGELPVTMITMRNEQNKLQLAAYIYKGPGGFYNNTNKLKLAFLQEELTLGSDLEGVFYRFIPVLRGTPLSLEEQEEGLRTFIAEFMDATHESSEGYL